MEFSSWPIVAVSLFLNALVTGLALAAAIALVFFFLKIRGVTLKFEVVSRDQDRGD